MNLSATIIADVVSSREIKPEELENQMQLTAKAIEKQFFDRKKVFDFFRGDSFQGIVPPELALRIALLWKAALKSVKTKKGSWDIRVSVGLGEIHYQSSKVATSSGPAFEFSGLLLDELKQKDRPGIGIRSFNAEWNLQYETECILADAIISRWTPSGAATVYNALMFNETQEEIARRLNISQSSVHKRYQAANWPAIRHWEQYFRKQIVSYLKTKEN